MPMYQRPAFWRVPHQRPDPDDEPRNYRRVTPNTPAGRELTRGDIIAKIDHYDARDLRHEDAQNLFKNAPNQIKLVVQRGRPSTHLYTLPRSTSYSFGGRISTPTFYRLYEDVDQEGPRTQFAARSPAQNAVPPPFRTPSPLPSSTWRGPESLPRSTPLPQVQYPPQLPQYAPQPFQPQTDGEYRTLLISPSANRNDEALDESIQSQGTAGDAVRDRSLDDTSALTSATMAVNPNFFPNGYQDPKHPDEEVVSNWPYRTTPLVLPGAKVRREPGPTESYLRHHPNPAIRAPPHHDYRDTLMKQKVVHKQFNSPINLYSEQNIANSIRQQTSPLPSNGHYGRHVVKSHLKPTLLYDPAKSETYRALQEGSAEAAQEVAEPAQTKVFTAPAAKKPAPAPKQPQPEAPKEKQTTFVNSLQEDIQQSVSFKRLMYNVLGNAEF